MNAVLHENHGSIGSNPGGSCSPQAPMGPGMAFFPGSARHEQSTAALSGPLMVVCPLAYPPGVHMHGIYAFSAMIPAKLQPQAGLNYTWANPYSRWTGQQPAGMLQQPIHHPGKTLIHPYLDQLDPFCPVDPCQIGSGSKPVRSNVQSEDPGHLMSKDTIQGHQPDDQDAIINIESALDCDRDFAQTLSKVMVKTSDCLMALLHEELDRLDKLDAENTAISNVQGWNSTPGIKPEAKAGETSQFDLQVVKCDGPDEALPALDEAGSQPQASDEFKAFGQVSLSGKLEAMDAVTCKPDASSNQVGKIRTDCGSPNRTAGKERNDSRCHQAPGLNTNAPPLGKGSSV